MKFVEKTVGGRVLSKDGLLYIKSKTLTKGRTYWECAQRRSGNGCNQKQPPEVFCKKGGLRNFAKFTGKHLRQRLFFKKKKSLWHRRFPVNFAKFLRTLFLQSTSGRLLLIQCQNNIGCCGKVCCPNTPAHSPR